MIDNRGFTACFMTYPEDHNAGTYNMLNMKTWKICTTRTVDWNNQSYGQTMKLTKENIYNLPFKEYEQETKDDEVLLDIGGTEVNQNKNENEIEVETVEEDDKRMTRSQTASKLSNGEAKNLSWFDDAKKDNEQDEGRVLRSGSVQERTSTLKETSIKDLDMKELCFIAKEHDIEMGYTPFGMRELCLLMKEEEEEGYTPRTF